MASRRDLVGSAVSVTTSTRWVRDSVITCSSDLVQDRGTVLACLDGLGAVLVGDGQVDHDRQDGTEEQHAGTQGPESETAVRLRGGEVVTDVGAQRAGQD